MDPIFFLPLLLGLAWLLPLASFVAIWLLYSLPQVAGTRASYQLSKLAGYAATAAILASLLLSLVALVGWWWHHPLHAVAPGHVDSPPHHASVAPYYAGDWYTFAQFGELRLSIGYYIDALTLLMFVLVTLIASCVHLYSTGYLQDELEDFVDPEVGTRAGECLRRPGRYHRFFQYLSLFCFSMLGLLLAGNLAMVFMFWELVGICSYFLIGFYIERRSASNAANKAFIVNRVGDFGLLIGLMALWSSLGTLHFAESSAVPPHQPDATSEQAAHTASADSGLFAQLRAVEHNYRLMPPAEMTDQSTPLSGYALLFIAGVGLFCGCVGKSAQFPLHVWLPDAMEGPTPVSALVHSATMVAAGVYLVGRCYPLFLPEVLLVIAVVGCLTLALAATIALTATDIKRVLAYSTVSQLGYMMLALGLGGWLAGLFHLITHACFKSLLFLGSGSVIHAVQTNDMRRMGGLRHKMPITAGTMLVGCLAIIGAGLPSVGLGLSGYYSKDAILEQAWNFALMNPSSFYVLLKWIPLAGAAVTALYMFRMWYLVFAGKPADADRYAHAHESPASMTRPLILLAVLAVGIGWSIPGTPLSITNMLEQARPAGTLATVHGEWLPELTVPDEHASHAPEIKQAAGWAAGSAALLGVAIATIIYLWHWLQANEIRDSFHPIYQLLWNKYWFDEIYQYLFVKPILWVSRLAATLDRQVIDRFVNAMAWLFRQLAHLLDHFVDRTTIDGSIHRLASSVWSLGCSLHRLQTGYLRQYVLFLVAGVLGLFALASLYWEYLVAV